jgi:hypothetical protein
MEFHVSFPSTPNGPIGVVHAEPGDLMDAGVGERARRDLGRLLGDMPIVLRCRLGDAVLLQGPEPLYRYAGSEADALPIVTIDARPVLRTTAA